MADFTIVAVSGVLVGAAVGYIRKAKKNGARCIGCPAGGNCAHNQKGASGCGCGCGSENSSKQECGCHTEEK